jgi:predicted nuclease of restriction endonuclease-like (RecB) superfamily
MSNNSQALPIAYAELLTDIKQHVRHAQTRAMLAVNSELIRLYWEIGALIDTRQQQEGWGAGVIPRLARDLFNELPEEKGFSERNIKRMLAFYREYQLLNFMPQAVAQTGTLSEVQQAAALFPAELLQAVPWGHHAELMAKVKDLPTRSWYMQAAVHNGWSRNILVMQIESAEEAEKWWFSVVDVIETLSDQPSHERARKYWSVMKTRLIQEGAELTTIGSQLKMQAYDGKMRLTDVGDTEQLLRIIQSVPSPKAEPFKLAIPLKPAVILREVAGSIREAA